MINKLLFYREMYRIRRIEQEIARVYPSDKIMSPIHLSIGQEPVSVAVCQALGKEDVVFGTYRSHALYLAKGGDLRQMIAELFGKSTGCAKGKGGSMHLIDPTHNIMGTSAIVSTSIPEAVGFAYAIKVQKQPRIVICFFGEGATEEGVFYESLQFAALKRLPLIFICENNLYAIHSSFAQRHANIHICDRVRSFGIPARLIENNDCEKIFNNVHTSRAACMQDPHAGPFFFECGTYRWNEHVGPGTDWHLNYRNKSELEYWQKIDPIMRFAEEIEPVEKARIDADIESELSEAFAYAEASPMPALTDLMTGVFADN